MKNIFLCIFSLSHYGYIKSMECGHSLDLMKTHFFHVFEVYLTIGMVYATLGLLKLCNVSTRWMWNLIETHFFHVFEVYITMSILKVCNVVIRWMTFEI